MFHLEGGGGEPASLPVCHQIIDCRIHHLSRARSIPTTVVCGLPFMHGMVGVDPPLQAASSPSPLGFPRFTIIFELDPHQGIPTARWVENTHGGKAMDMMQLEIGQVLLAVAIMLIGLAFASYLKRQFH
jgi:hypothetical protein